jgi:hypothetical protein
MEEYCDFAHFFEFDLLQHAAAFGVHGWKGTSYAKEDEVTVCRYGFISYV